MNPQDNTYILPYFPRLQGNPVITLNRLQTNRIPCTHAFHPVNACADSNVFQCCNFIAHGQLV